MASERAAKGRDGRWYLSHDADVVHENADEAVHPCEDACTRIIALLPDEEMKTVFRLCAEGERRTSIFASALGLSDLGVTEQNLRIKRAKDRMKKYLTRHECIRAIGRAAVAKGDLADGAPRENRGHAI